MLGDSRNDCCTVQITCEQIDRGNESESQQTAHCGVVVVVIVERRAGVGVRGRPVADTDEAQKEHGRDDVERETCPAMSLQLVPLVRHEVRPPY